MYPATSYLFTHPSRIIGGTAMGLAARPGGKGDDGNILRFDEPRSEGELTRFQSPKAHMPQRISKIIPFTSGLILANPISWYSVPTRVGDRMPFDQLHRRKFIMLLVLDFVRTKLKVGDSEQPGPA